MKKTIYTILLFVLILFTAVKSQTIEQLGYYNINGLDALTSKSNLLVLGSGDIVNISNPSRPELIGSLSLNGFSTSVLVSEDYAYFGTGMLVRLIIADISNPTFPLQISSINFPETGGGVFGIAKSDDILYLAMSSAGVYSVDISDVSTPKVLDTLVIEYGQARDIVTKGNYAYVAHGDGLKVLDISNPLNMQIITSIGSGYNSIDINDSLLFLGKGSGGIDVFKISDPLTPAFSIVNSGGAWDVKYQKNHVYLATNSSGLFIYKIEGNTGIEMANFPNTGNGQSFGVSLQDSLILLIGLVNGVAILQYDSTGTSSINTLSLENKIRIFPNPVIDHIIIDQSNISINKIEIIDMEGKLIKQENYNSSTKFIDISDLPIGQYIIKIIANESIITEKFIKIE